MLMKIIKNSKLLFSLAFMVPLVAQIPNPTGDYIGVTALDQHSVRINFVDNSNNESGFLLQSKGGLHHLISKNDEQKHIYQYYNLTDLRCDQTYSIQILAYNQEGNSTLTPPRDFNIQTTFDLPCEEENLPPQIETDEFTYIWNSGSLFTLIATDTDGEITSCEATIEGNRLSCQPLTPSSFEIQAYFFDTPATYTMHITLTDNQGATSSKDIPINVLQTDKVLLYLNDQYQNATIKKGQTIAINAVISCSDSSYPPSYQWISTQQDAFSTIPAEEFYPSLSPLTKGLMALYTPTQTGEHTISLQGTCEGETLERGFNFRVVDANESFNPTQKITVDYISHLIWQENNQSITKVWSEENTYNTAGDTAKSYCDQLDWAGYQDWRIPIIEEILSHISPTDEAYWAQSAEWFYDIFPALSSHYQRVPYDQSLRVICVRDN